MRESEDTTWMDVARTVAKRSKCEVQVGTVIIGTDGRIVATGYNGPPADYWPAEGALSCRSFCDRQCAVVKAEDYSDCPAIHAEVNALLYSDRTLREGGTVYVTSVPCLACAKALANSGIAEVVYDKNDLYYRSHRNPYEAIQFLERCSIKSRGI